MTPCATLQQMGESLVRRLMDDRFTDFRDPRSNEYMSGARAQLRGRINHAIVKCPFEPGSAAHDAFFAGIAEGERLWREHAGL